MITLLVTLVIGVIFIPIRSRINGYSSLVVALEYFFKAMFLWFIMNLVYTLSQQVFPSTAVQKLNFNGVVASLIVILFLVRHEITRSLRYHSLLYTIVGVIAVTWLSVLPLLPSMNLSPPLVAQITEIFLQPDFNNVSNTSSAVFEATPEGSVHAQELGNNQAAVNHSADIRLTCDTSAAASGFSEELYIRAVCNLADNAATLIIPLVAILGKLAMVVFKRVSFFSSY